jgi:hypothetical protein
VELQVAGKMLCGGSDWCYSVIAQLAFAASRKDQSLIEGITARCCAWQGYAKMVSNANFEIRGHCADTELQLCDAWYRAAGR